MVERVDDSSMSDMTSLLESPPAATPAAPQEKRKGKGKGKSKGKGKEADPEKKVCDGYEERGGEKGKKGAEGKGRRKEEGGRGERDMRVRWRRGERRGKEKSSLFKRERQSNPPKK
jgi:hypothetical protein